MLRVRVVLVAVRLVTLTLVVPVRQMVLARVTLARPGMRLAALAAIVLSAGFALVPMAAFLTIPETLTGLYLNPADPKAPVIVALAASLMLYAGLFQLADAMQAFFRAKAREDALEKRKALWRGEVIALEARQEEDVAADLVQAAHFGRTRH